METKELKNFIELINQKSKFDLINNLNKRKKNEIEFHNKDRTMKHSKDSISKEILEKNIGNSKYYAFTEYRKKYIKKWVVENCKNRVFLDYACGLGEYALLTAKNGAELSIGIDISDYAISCAAEKAKNAKISNVIFFQGDCEKTGLPDESIDTIICSGMLHHLDLSYAFYELRRILKPGGKILAIEALNYNPLFKLYRNLTPSMRTEWEKDHILSYKELEFAKRFFTVSNIKHWHLLGVMSPHLPFLSPIFNKIDQLILRIPLVNRLSWMFSFELIKNRDDNE